MTPAALDALLSQKCVQKFIVKFQKKDADAKFKIKKYTMSMGVNKKEILILQKYAFVYVSMVVHKNNNVTKSFIFSSPSMKNSSSLLPLHKQKIHTHSTFPPAY